MLKFIPFLSVALAKANAAMTAHTEKHGQPLTTEAILVMCEYIALPLCLSS